MSRIQPKFLVAISLIVVVGFSGSSAAQEKSRFCLGFFEGGECLGHQALRSEYMRQLRQILPDSLEVITIPQGYRSAEWKRENSRTMAAELVQVKELDLVVTMGPWVVEDLLAAGFDRPIIAMNRVNPAFEGLLDEDGRPIAENLTVHVKFGKPDNDLKALVQLVKVRKLGLLYFPTGDETDRIVSQVSELGKEYGFEVVAAEGFDKFGTFAFFKAYRLLQEKPDALYLFPFWGMNTVKTREFLAMTTRDRIPTFAWEGKCLVDQGAFAGNTGLTWVGEARFNALKTVRILTGETPADLPVEFSIPTGLTINEQTAAACRVKLTAEMNNESHMIGTAPDEQTVRYNPAEIISRALNQNPGYLACYDVLEAAAQAAGQAYAAYLPRLRAEYAVTRFDNNTVANSEGKIDQNRSAATLKLEQTIFSLDAIKSIQLAAKRKELERLNLEQAQLDLELAATIAYLNYLRSEAILNIERENRAQIDRHVELAQTRQQIEGGDRVDLVRWKQERHKATGRLIRAISDLSVARVLLNVLINLPGNTPFALDGGQFDERRFSDEYFQLYPFLNSFDNRAQVEQGFVNRALQLNPAIRSFEVKIDLQRDQLGQNKARYFPTVGFQASLNRVDELADQPGEFKERMNTWSVGGIIKLPLFIGTDRMRERARLKARLSEIEYVRDAATLEIMGDVLNCMHNLVSERESTAKNYRSETLALEALGLVQSAYEAGTAGLVELLDAQSNNRQARLATTHAQYDYYQAMARLVRKVGWSLYDQGLPLSEVFFEGISDFVKTGR